MKRLLLVSFIILLFSCQNTEVVSDQSINYSSVIESLNSAHRGALNAALNGDSEHVYSNSFDFLKGGYFSGDLKLDTQSIKDNTSGRTANREIDLSFLTTAQQAIARPFLSKITMLEEISEVAELTDDFNTIVVASSLQDEEKYQLLSISSSVKIAAEFIQNALNAHSINGRAQKVDVKGALQAGVVGLGIGAVRGAYVGCAGGTVAFPGLGTASGCVGGAVIGGAVGFIGGVATSILQDLLF